VIIADLGSHNGPMSDANTLMTIKTEVNSATSDLDCTYNYWGHPSGPAMGGLGLGL
jgi:hypothetical protein